MWLQVISLLMIRGIMTQAVTLEARVSVAGVKGMVTFTQANPGEQVMIRMSLSGPNSGQAITWRLNTFRLNYDVMDRCNLSNLGPRILESVVGNATIENQTASGLELSGMNSIEGRSITFHDVDGNPVACATVESTDNYVTARATFRKTVLGQVIVRQQRGSSLALTRVTVDLYSDGSENSERDLEWRIVEDSGCSSVGSAYNPGSVIGTCNSSNHASCSVGDLTSKLGMVKVGATMGSSRGTWVDLNLPLSGASSVMGKTLQLFLRGQSTPLACAIVTAFTARTGVAVFDNDGVTGKITVTQPSPLDPTMTSVDLQNLRSQAGGYHVHKYPVPQRLTTDRSVQCSAASVSDHFNPFEVVYTANSPAAAASTEDMYEVGDLSKKYGVLNGLGAKKANYTDYNLPLFGINSVLGRSIVIHYNQTNSPRWVCTNIQDTAALTSALATFTFPVIGHVLLQQRVGEEGETTLYYQLDYADGFSPVSRGHAWAVHQNAISDDMLADSVSARCASAGDIINPLGVNGMGYDSQCKPSNPLRCKLGDLTGKHRAASIRAGPATPAIGFFTDLNLPLQGPLSVLGRSLVIKAANGSMDSLACANLLKVWPQVLEASIWGSGPNFGSVTFSQQVGVIQAPTTVAVDLKGVSSFGQIAYGVSVLPVNSQDGAVRCDSLGDVYNPFQVSTPGTTKDAVAMGNLTAKFGALSGSGPVTGLTFLDPSLDVWGPRGVGGRAFFLSSTSGSSRACADIVPKPLSGGRLFTAKAVFSGEVTGQITLMQYLYPEGAMTPTSVKVNLRKASGNQTQAHNWHTHVTPVGNDSAATAGRCASTGGHYNPFKVNVKDQYSECSLTNPLRCELGDQSSKLGTYDMDSGLMVATDVYLPLAGPYGVIGRSIVVHMADRGAPRLACADVLPADHSMAHLYSINTPPSMDRLLLVQKIAEVLSTQTYNLAAEYMATDRTYCTDLRVYFLGMEDALNKQKFIDMLQNNPGALGIYQPSKQCSTSSAYAVQKISLLILLASLTMGYLLN